MKKTWTRSSQAVDTRQTADAQGLLQRGWAFIRRTSGQSVTEFAVLLPIFILIVFATLEVGRVYVVQQHLNSAARLGARTGTIRNSSVAEVQAAMDTYLSSTEVGVNYTPTVTGVSANADFNTLVTVSLVHNLQLFTSLDIPGLPGVTVPLSSSVTMRHQ